VRFFTLCATGVIALTVAACGGGGDENFTQEDVLQILKVAPTMPPGPPWTKQGGISQESFEELLSRGPEAEGAYKDEIAALADAGFQRGFSQTWVSSHAAAIAEASLFPDAAAAQKGFAALGGMTPGWFLPVPVEDLGDEAETGHGDLGAGYRWRSGNLVLSAWAFRGGGAAFDYDAAARAYADKLDERATTG
jgi:hypothetical protein